MSSDTIEITFTAIANGGEAIGRLPDGRTVFVPFAVVGERARIQLVEEKARYARGRLVEVLTPAPGRVPARCKHFGFCGGCQFQHLAYAAQLEAKAQILRDQLIHIGQMPDPPVAPTVGSPSPWNYRNQVQFHVTPDGALGFVAAREGRRVPGILMIEECHLPDEHISALWPHLKFDGSAGPDRITVRSDNAGALMLILESNSPGMPDVEVEVPISIIHTHGSNSDIQTGDDHLTLKVRDRAFKVSPDSFFQVNVPVAERMVDFILAHVPPTSGMVIDAYCGAGLFSAFLAGRCSRLIGIESSPSACQDFSANLDEFENVELYEDAVEHVLPALGVQAEVVLVDPPRAGVEKPALDAIVEMKPAVILYVSCDPATLARDARRLGQAGYEPQSIVPFDMFPQTHHIESISVFRR